MSTSYSRKDRTVTTTERNEVTGDTSRDSKTFPSINLAKKFMRDQVTNGDTSHLMNVSDRHGQMRVDAEKLRKQLEKAEAEARAEALQNASAA